MESNDVAKSLVWVIERPGTIRLEGRADAEGESGQ
jgi:hypothetical protein